VWEIAEEVLEPLIGPFRFQLEQSFTLTDYESVDSLQHPVIGGKPPLIYTFPRDNNRSSESGGLEFQPSSALANPSLERAIINYANTYKLRSPEDVAQFQQQCAPFLERVSGREPQGLLFLSRIAVRAADSTQPEPQRAEIGYYVAFEIPDSVTKPIFESRWAASSQARAASEREVERQLQEVQQQKEDRGTAREQTERERVVRQSSRTLLGIGIPILVCLPIWLLLSRTPRPDSTARRYRGVAIASSGLLPLLLILSTSFPFLAAIRPSEAWLAQNSRLLFGSALLFMGLMFVTGTMVAAYDKGYRLRRGFLLGLIAPLGLLVVILLPDKSSANASDRSGQDGQAA
ncbi:MAG TPA: hypothetical protein VLA12_01005, partial [Planctomycetaceae bacterium]|nr:hypothetical protein [Planctomycetaceae bacterium]